MKANRRTCADLRCGHAECEQMRDISHSRCVLCGTQCGTSRELLDQRTPAQVEAGIFYTGFVHARCEHVLKHQLLKRLTPKPPKKYKPNHPGYNTKALAKTGFDCYGDVLYEVPVATEDGKDSHPDDTFNLSTFPKKAARRVTYPKKTDWMKLDAADRRNAAWRRKNSNRVFDTPAEPPLDIIDQITHLEEPRLLTSTTATPSSTTPPHPTDS